MGKMVSNKLGNVIAHQADVFLFFLCSDPPLTPRDEAWAGLVSSRQRPVVVTLLGANTATGTIKNMKNGPMSHVPSVQFGRLNLRGPFDSPAQA